MSLLEDLQFFDNFQLVANFLTAQQKFLKFLGKRARFSAKFYFIQKVDISISVQRKAIFCFRKVVGQSKGLSKMLSKDHKSSNTSKLDLMKTVEPTSVQQDCFHCLHLYIYIYNPTRKTLAQNEYHICIGKFRYTPMITSIQELSSKR